MNPWNLNQIPDQSDRVAVVTSANTGICFETAAALAAHNATVVLACRNELEAKEAMERIRTRTPEADARRLWQVSETLTGVHFPSGDSVAA